MNRPSVSILVPAFRPDWLDVAIASALAQTHADFELLVSDDSLGDDIARVMQKWDDPRIRHVRNPNRGVPGANRDHLIAQACGEYLKFLFDDDFLFPRSIELLVQASRATGARLAFHARHLVDKDGRVLSSPSLVAPGKTVLLERSFYFGKLVGQCLNLIGEPTNILIHADTLRGMVTPFGIDGRRMRFLTDVALYTNFAAAGHGLVGVGYHGSAFRQHDSQTSGASYAGYAAAFYEWELIRRWSVDAGLLDRAAYAAGLPSQRALYARGQPQHPELAGFIALDGQADAGRYLGPRFVETMALADLTIDMRKLATVD